MRQSPLLMVYKGISLIRNTIFFYLFLFVVKEDSTATIIELARHSFWWIVCLSAFYIFANWSYTTFQLDEHHLTKRSGILFRKTQQIPVSQLEQATVKRHWFHRLTNTVAYTYQLADADEQLKIEMIDARKMNRQPEQKGKEDLIFQPTTRQLIKATFTSFRFLLAIPFGAALYSRVDHFIQLEPYTMKFVENLKTDTVWQIWTIVAYIVVSVICALVFTFVKFGNDRVIKEAGTLVIQKGLLSQSKMTIELEKIDGVEIRQTFLKRKLGLAEIRLQFKSNDENDLQSIYPYFEYKQAMDFMKAHFPQFVTTGEPQRLAKAALIPRLLRGSVVAFVLWGICFAIRAWLPIPFYWGGLWLTFIVFFGVVAAYRQFQVIVDEERVQLRAGLFGSKLTTIRLRNVVGLEYEQSLLQRVLGVHSITVRTYTEEATEYQLKDVGERVVKELQSSVLAKAL